MVTTLIIFVILTVFIIGLILVYSRHSRIIKKIEFAGEYRNKFIECANMYFQTYDSWNRKGNLDRELYVWLTMNVNKIQDNIGSIGVMTYRPAFQNYMINNYPIIINTIPKFSDGTIESFEINSVDNSLLRYIGSLEEYSKTTFKNLKNPIIWFREGFREILSIPVFILSWFGIISNRTVNSIKDSLIYKVFSGLTALVMLVSSIVTIVVGYDQTIEFVTRLLEK